MNDALFKQLAQELSPEEESEFTRRLAAAYREHEARERSPEVERITKLIRERLEQDKDASGAECTAPRES
jgi:hypothetical protein